MELPHMGQHCSEEWCNKLDYLPMKCDACSLLFCTDHLLYDDHKCASKYKKDVQVPVCPLCNAPVPFTRGTLPDLAVSAHIDQDCKKKQPEKVFTNKCSKHKCKKKELIKCICSSCQLNYCLTHRHPNDHSCEGGAAGARRAAASAAAERAAAADRRAGGQSTQSKITNFFSGPFRPDPAAGSRPTAAGSRPVAAGSRPVAAGSRQAAAGSRQAPAASFQNGMSEDEALAAALAASMNEFSSPQQSSTSSSAAASTQEDEDRRLAQAIQESERAASLQEQQQSGAGEKSCSIS
jgi:predicted nucleic acid binding AN1-type Zn finger protein